MPEDILERIALSPYLRAVLEGFEELSYFQDKVQIIQDLIALQVEQKTKPFYPHPSPLEKYCSEEAEVLLHIFEMLQIEIEEQIKAIEATKKTYNLPQLH